MSFTITATRSWAQAGQDPLSYQKAKTGGSLVSVSETVPAGWTDYEILVPTIDLSALLALLIASNKDVKIETGHPGGTSGAPDDTLNLVGDQPVVWLDDDVEACPITADVLVIYVTNTGATDANIEIRALMDPTP